MASSWRSLLKDKIHSVLSGDKEIKEQFLGRWQDIEQKVSHASACEGRLLHVDWPKPVKLLTPDVPNPEVLDDFLTMKKIEFYGINLS